MEDKTPNPARGHIDDTASPDALAIRVRGLTVGFGERTIMENLDLDVRRGEVLGFVGASGAGKSVLTRTILGLVRKRAGAIEVLGQDLDALDGAGRRALERRWGVLFQHGALFSALTVKQNVQAPMREYLDLSDRLLLRDLSRLAELLSELRGLEGVSRITTVKAEDESEL